MQTIRTMGTVRLLAKLPNLEHLIYVIDAHEEKVLRVFRNKTGRQSTWLRIKKYAEVCAATTGHSIVLAKATCFF